MRVRVTGLRFIPNNAVVAVNDEFQTIAEPSPNLFPITGSVVVTAPKVGGGTVRTWLLAGSWEKIQD